MPAAGVGVTNVDMADMAAVRAAIIPGRTKLVLVESPTNPRMQVGARGLRGEGFGGTGAQ